jgi:site-specific recombinase XerD
MAVNSRQWSRRWLQALAAKGYSPETLKNYRIAVDQYLGFLIETSRLPNAVSSFTPQTVSAFGKALHDYKLKPQSAVIKLLVKGRKPKTISIPALVAERLLGDAAARQAGADAPLLVNALGQRWLRTSLSEAFARLARAAGITRVRAEAHQFRHALVVIARTDCGLDLVEQAALPEPRRHADRGRLPARAGR